MAQHAAATATATAVTNDADDHYGGRVDVTASHAHKQWHTDEDGVKREFHGRNKAQDNLKHDDHHRDLDVRTRPIVAVVGDLGVSGDQLSSTQALL